MDALLDLVKSLRNEFIWFAICLSVPSIILNLLEIITTLRHKQFHNSFYFLFNLRAITDMVCELNSYYCYRLIILFGDFFLPLYSMLPDCILDMAYFLSTGTFQATNLATILVLANRLTAIGMPLKYKKYWKRCHVPSAMIVFGIPTILNYKMFQMDPYLWVTKNPDNSSSFVILEKSNGALLANRDFLAFLMGFIFLILCFLINIAIVIVYRKQSSRIAASSAEQENYKIERKLLAYSIATFIGHALIAMLMVGRYWASGDQALTYIVNSQYPWIMDTGTVGVSSWLLLWASDSFRIQFLDDWVPKRLLRALGYGNGGTVPAAVASAVNAGSGSGSNDVIVVRTTRGVAERRL